MTNPVLKHAVRTLFTLTSSARVKTRLPQQLDAYMRLAETIDGGQGSRPVQVPPMPGVDEDMRGWSFYMILEHNTLVNRSITAIVGQLARDEEPSGLALINPKTGVTPSGTASTEQLTAFQDSVHEHLRSLEHLGKLRGTKTMDHPVFGEFDAHKWNCMFSFHLKIHYKQAAYVIQWARKNSGA
jgi:hypothetical protein